MKSYCISFCNLNGCSIDKLFENPNVIYGKSPMDAMKKAFPGKKITPIYGYENQKWFSNVIMEECTISEYGIRFFPGKKVNCYKVEN